MYISILAKARIHKVTGYRLQSVWRRDSYLASLWERVRVRGFLKWISAYAGIDKRGENPANVLYRPTPRQWYGWQCAVGFAHQLKLSTFGNPTLRDTKKRGRNRSFFYLKAFKFSADTGRNDRPVLLWKEASRLLCRGR